MRIFVGELNAMLNIFHSYRDFFVLSAQDVCYSSQRWKTNQETNLSFGYIEPGLKSHWPSLLRGKLEGCCHGSGWFPRRVQLLLSVLRFHFVLLKSVHRITYFVLHCEGNWVFNFLRLSQRSGQSLNEAVCREKSRRWLNTLQRDCFWTEEKRKRVKIESRDQRVRHAVAK